MSRSAVRKDVDMLAVQLLLAIHEARGLKAEALLEGVPLTVEQTRSRRVGVAWDTYIELCDRVRDELGGNDVMADMAAEKFPSVTEHFTSFAGLFVSPVRLVQFLATVVDPRIWPCMQTTFEQLEPDLVRVVHALPAHFRSGDSMFSGAIGAWRTVPSRLGLAEAEMVEVTIDTHRAEFLMRLPKARTISARARQAAMVAFAFYANEELEAEAAFASGNFVPGGDAEAEKLALAHARWKLTERERQTLGLVVQGLSNKEIARNLDCAVRTVEVHVSKLMLKSGTRSRAQLVTRFWTA